MAEEEAENGEGAEENDKDVGEEGEEAGIAEGAVVIDEAPTCDHYPRFPYLIPHSSSSSSFPPPPILLLLITFLDLSPSSSSSSSAAASSSSSNLNQRIKVKPVNQPPFLFNFPAHARSKSLLPPPYFFRLY